MIAFASIEVTLRTKLVLPAAHLTELPLFNNFITCAGVARRNSHLPTPAGARAHAAVSVARASELNATVWAAPVACAHRTAWSL